MSQAYALSRADFLRPTIRLGLPVALQNLLISSFGIVDTLMLGQLGDVAVASVGMAAQWAWLMHIFFYGVSSGASVFLSQYWGAKDFSGIRRAYGLLLAITLGIAAVMTLLALLAPSLVIGLFTSDSAAIETGVSYLRIACVSYFALAFSQVFSTVLRSTEQVRLPLISSIVAVILNTVLNYGLIFGKLGMPEMGVRGAAIATAISSWGGVATLFGLSVWKKNLLICKLRELFSFDRAFAKHFLRVCAPAAVNEMTWALGTLGYNMVFGRMGTAQYAAITIFRTVEGMFFSFYIGICHACGVMVGREIGAGRTNVAVAFAKKYLIFMPIFSAMMGVLMILTRGPFLGLFNVSETVVRDAMTIMLIFAINIPVRNLSYIGVCGIFRPGGDTKIGLLYDVLTVWCLALPATAIAGLVLKLDFVLVYALMLVLEDWIKSPLCVARVLSLKWIQPVVEKEA